MSFWTIQFKCFAEELNPILEPSWIAVRWELGSREKSCCTNNSYYSTFEGWVIRSSHREPLSVSARSYMSKRVLVSPLREWWMNWFGKSRKSQDQSQSQKARHQILPKMWVPWNLLGSRTTAALVYLGVQKLRLPRCIHSWRWQDVRNNSKRIRKKASSWRRAASLRHWCARFREFFCNLVFIC